MSGIWGEYLKISLFGESHGPAVGVVIDGLPAGIEISEEEIQRELDRRAPGKSKLVTARREPDKFEILSGVFQNKTSGTPLCAVIFNRDRRSRDYEELKDIVRPGHADYTARIKYSGFNDYRGGGHFSGRLTAPLVFAGAIAKGILKQKEIYVGSHLASIGGIEDELFNPVDIRADLLLNLNAQEMPLLKKELEALITEKILEVKADSDSVGGIVETAVIGLQPGLGSPFFDSVESKIAHLIFSIPAVKGLEFGAGFRFGSLKGSQANDPFYWEEGKVKTKTNNCGGILGGITNGMPVIFRTAFKPTPSIGQTQETVDLAKKENTLLSIRGRHDPCLVLRAIPVVEALSSLAVVEMIIEKEGKTWF